MKALQKQGASQRAVSRQLSLHQRTVSKYFALDQCPERISGLQCTSTVTPYLPYLTNRWQAGCQNIKELHVELEGQGFTGHYASVYRAVKQLLANGQMAMTATPVTIPIPRLSAT